MKKKTIKIGLLTVVLIVVILTLIAVINMHSVVTKVAKNNAEQEALGIAEEEHVLEEKTFSSAYSGIEAEGILPNLTGSKKVLTASEGDGSTISIPKGYYENIKIDATAVYNKGMEDADARANAESVNYQTGYNAGVTATKKGTAGKDQVLTGYTFTNSGKVEENGNMPNNGAVSQTINPGGSYTIPEGYHDGTGTVTANPNQNDGKYTYPENSTGGDVDMGVNNTYRYVNATNVYNKGKADGIAATKKGTAGAAQVLSGYTFTNSSSVEASGTMTDKSNSTTANGGADISNNLLRLKIPTTGYYSNTNSYITADVGTATAAEVLSGKTFTSTAGVKTTGTIASLGATTYNTSTSDQTIASGKYLSGTQTIKAVTTSNIDAANIKKGVVVKVGDANNAGRIKNVTGTYTSDATATAAQILSGKTAYVNGSKVTGTMPSHADLTESIVTYWTSPDYGPLIYFDTGYWNGGENVNGHSCSHIKITANQLKDFANGAGVGYDVGYNAGYSEGRTQGQKDINSIALTFYAETAGNNGGWVTLQIPSQCMQGKTQVRIRPNAGTVDDYKYVKKSVGWTSISGNTWYNISSLNIDLNYWFAITGYASNTPLSMFVDLK